MRKKVKRILALLLAIGLAVSVTSGIALSTSAETDAAQVSQEEPVEPEPAAASEEPAAEPAQEKQEGSEKADPEPAAEEEEKGEAEEPTSTGEALDQTVTVGSGDKTVKVRTTAEAGVLPEGATLVVKQLEKDDSQYEDAVDQLEANEITYDGMLALDVGFEVNGQKVEPTGSVDVKFELGAGLLPEDADTDSLAVQHLPDSSKVETVADAGNATEGTVTVQDQKVNADFTVDSFSYFTITYTYLFWDDTIKVYCVNTNGEQIIGDADSTITPPKSEAPTSWEDIMVYVPELVGYRYVDAHLKSYTGTPITYIKYQTGLWNSGWRYSAAAEKPADSNAGSAIENGNAIYLVYQAESSGGGSGGTGGEITAAGEPAHTKTAIRNDDGTYDLSLTVKGSQGTKTDPAKVDVLMIIDVSGSMDDYGRLANLKSAMNALVNTIESKEDIDARYSIVKFSGPDDETAAQVSYWWNTADNIGTVISSLSADGGTNYQAGIRKGKTQLNSARTEAQKIVIFLSDGKPTYYIGGGNGQNTIGDTGWTQTKKEAAGMSCDRFYAIGIGSEMSTYLEGIRDSVNATTKEYIEANSDGSNLTEKFNNIAGSVSDIFCTNVTITDTLSDKAEMVMNGDQPSKMVVSVTDGEGNKITTPVGITASYNKDTKTITLDFPDDYELNPDYTYAVTVTIQPSDAAYTAYAGTYPDTPDAGTGTHADANEKGFYCNSTATLSYNNGEEDKTATYAKPVIQLNKCSVTLKKVVAGNMGDTNKDFGFAVTGGTVTGSTDGTTTLKHNGTVTITARVGAQITITETDYSGDGYTTTASSKKNDTDTEIGTCSGRTYTFTMGSTMTEATVITFTNTKNVEVPNGLTHNITPYIIMVVLAAGAGVYFVMRRRPRGRHCK